MDWTGFAGFVVILWGWFVIHQLTAIGAALVRIEEGMDRAAARAGHKGAAAYNAAWEEDE